MRLTAALSAATLSLLLASSAAAEELPPRDQDVLGETYVGVRSGYSLPLGNLWILNDAVKVPLADIVSGAVPLWVDAQYHPLPELELGLSMIMGIAFANDAPPLDEDTPVTDVRGCPEGTRCRTGVLRPGGHVIFHPWPEARVHPWVGAGVGYGWFLFNRKTGDTRQKMYWHGPEIIAAQLGADLRVSDSTWIGVFGAFQVFRAVDCGLRTNQRPQSCGIVERAQHEWLTVGLRVRTHFWTIYRAQSVTARM